MELSEHEEEKKLEKEDEQPPVNKIEFSTRVAKRLEDKNNKHPNLTIWLKSSAAKKEKYDVTMFTTIRKLKLIIEEKEKTRLGRAKLLFNGKYLHDDKILKFYGVRNGGSIYVEGDKTYTSLF